jgi:hypothetical protein
MNFIDVLILFVSTAGLVFFFLDRIRYSNRNVYYKKLERLRELEEEIRGIISANDETENLIINMDFDTGFDGSVTDRLVKYRDDYDRLEALRNEHRETGLYLRNARPYIKEIF